MRIISAHFLASLFMLPLTGQCAGNKLPAADQIALITAAAQQAQQRCYEFMHEDADEFISCIDALDHAIKRRNQAARLQHLGINYFGWVGANNSARLSLPGAEAAAQKYLLGFQYWQKRANIDQLSLCKTVAGDCNVRLAQIQQMSRSGK